MHDLIEQIGVDRHGVKVIEYGLIAVVVALALTVSLPSIRRNVSGMIGSAAPSSAVATGSRG
jgi:Flp pilus assembly pilin Flp